MPWAFIDFRDTVYYPARALLAGLNPYDTVTYRQHFPANPFPPFAPLTLAVYAPFALLGPAAAAWTWFVVTILLTLVLAAVTLAHAGVTVRAATVLGLATLVLASRPGGMNLLLGQQTMPLVLAAYAALLGAPRRPWLAILGVALSTGKPQFGIPLACLLAAAGHVRIAVLGLATSALASLAVLAVMPSAPGSGMIGTFLGAATASAAKIEGAATVWWSRIDLPYLAHHLVGGALGGLEPILALGVLVGGALTVWRLARRRDPGDDQLGFAVTALSVLLAVYHQVYDTLLLVLPLTLAVLGRANSPWEHHARLRWTVAALLAFPAVNFVATYGVIERLGLGDGWWRALTSLNAACLLLAWVLHTGFVWARYAAPAATTSHD